MATWAVFKCSDFVKESLNSDGIGETENIGIEGLLSIGGIGFICGTQITLVCQNTKCGSIAGGWFDFGKQTGLCQQHLKKNGRY